MHITHAYTEEQKMGNIDAARKLLYFALERDPNDGLIYQSLALIEQNEGRIVEARRLLEEGVTRDQTNVFLWSARGVFESRQGRLQEAAQMYQQATKLDSKHYRTWQAFGVLLEKLNRCDEACDKFERALEIKPTSVPTLQAYGLMEARRGRYDQARELFERGVAIESAHAPIFHAWARMEEILGNHDRARELLHQGVESAPDSVALLQAWSKMELQLGHIDTSSPWDVKRNMNSHKMSSISERLQMLRLLIGQRSEKDMMAVMKWVENQRRQQLQANVSKLVAVGNSLPPDWKEGQHYICDIAHSYAPGELVVVPATTTTACTRPRDEISEERSVKLCFGRIVGSQKFFGGKVNVDKKDIKIFRNDTETENGNVVVVHVGRCKAGANFQKEALLPLYIVNVPGTDLESLTGSKITSKKSKRNKANKVGLSSLAQDCVPRLWAPNMLTDQFSVKDVAKVVLTNSQLIEMQRLKYHKEVESIRGPSIMKRQRIGSLLRKEVLDRYGELDTSSLPNLPGVFEEVLDGQSPDVGWDKEEAGLKQLEQWLTQRSDDDISNFSTWFKQAYQKDAKVGMKILEWKMHSLAEFPNENQRLQVPREWTRLEEPAHFEKAMPWDKGHSALMDCASPPTARKQILIVQQQETEFFGRIVQAGVVLALGACSTYLFTFTDGAFDRLAQISMETAQPVKTSLKAGSYGGVDAHLIKTDFSDPLDCEGASAGAICSQIWNEAVN